MRLLSPATLFLLRGAHALSWSPLGPPIPHPFVLASSCAFSDLGSPLLSLGAGASLSDPSTTTLVEQWDGARWALLDSHTPQYPQPYEHFSLRARGGSVFVGLVINPADSAAAGLSSILRSVKPGGGEDGMEGSYAFASSSWAWDVSDNGGARAAVASPDNATLSLTSYPPSGWAGYPASNAWTPLIPIASPVGGLAAVAATRGAESLFVAYAAGADGAVEVGATPLGASQAWHALGPPFASAALARQPVAPALAWGGGVLCAAAHGARPGEVLVACARVTANGTTTSGWAPAALALTGAAPGLPPGIALQAGGSGGGQRLVAAAAMGGGSGGAGGIISAVCELPGAGVPSCAPMALKPLQFSGQPVTDFDLCAPAHGQAANASFSLLLVVATGPSDGTGDSLAAMTLQ